ncbi:transcriptional repressor p66-alpha-like isoform X2 [Megalobrama amblycephala]|uniref:transcriptional repressor p66-alpha-like isoform X2 n=1 Tax=Megalobrama amblycephala TaxID=75352 RepID=UPI0020145189|nr:transcriptional repressor p66-alpha-like isoform X2 [Megalobrama amblycephala]
MRASERHNLAARRRSGTGRARATRARGFPRIIRENYRTNRPEEPRCESTARPAAVMSEEAVRRTRSQKRALERESLPADSKRLKLDGVERSRALQASSILSGGEVKATIKVEVQTRDEPMDVSAGNTEMKRERRSPSPDDVIVLSDEAPSPKVNGGNHLKELDTDLLMRSSAEERKRVVKQLKEELRLEEAKLILLKKIRHSQIHKDSQKPAVSVSNTPLVKSSATAKAAQPQVVSARASGTVIPPPLVRGGQVSKPGSASAQIIMPPLVRGAQSISVSPQQISSLRQQQNSTSGPPPLLLAPRATVTGVQGHKIIQPGLIRMATIPSASLLAAGANLKSSSAASNASESPASRQAAAKLALRKQLEKALLEIPPPKPPAPEFNFLPSAANNEFIYLLGLEEVVQNLLESLGRGKQGLYAGLVVSAGEPSCCSQCKTDFTCRWRKDKGGATMCEQCMSSNHKKVLKAEHTNRLKAAFVKALQQEQEIEQRILQQATPPASSSSSSSSSAHGVKQRSLQQTMSRHPAAIKQVSPSSRSVQQSAAGIRAVPHSFSPSSQLQNAVAAAALVNRPGKHAVHQGSKVSRGSSRSADPMTSSGWRKRSRGAAGVTMAYVNPSLSVHKTSSSAVERHREYLLDMIPSRSVSQPANTWK